MKTLGFAYVSANTTANSIVFSLNDKASQSEYHFDNIQPRQQCRRLHQEKENNLAFDRMVQFSSNILSKLYHKAARF